jgi:hypothetical protein
MFTSARGEYYHIVWLTASEKERRRLAELSLVCPASGHHWEAAATHAACLLAGSFVSLFTICSTRIETPQLERWGLFRDCFRQENKGRHT